VRSKNSKAISPAERDHMERVKGSDCSFCDGPGGYAHHIRQGDHWTTVATCYDCHQGPQGIHGDQTLQRIYKRDELAALNITIRRIYG